MAKQATPKAEILRVGFNFTINHRNPATPDAPESVFQDSVYLDLNDEQVLNKVLNEKPFLKLVIPILVEKFNKEFDANNASANELKSKISGILSA